MNEKISKFEFYKFTKFLTQNKSAFSNFSNNFSISNPDTFYSKTFNDKLSYFSKENLFLKSLKYFKVKTKVRNTNYKFFEYFFVNKNQENFPNFSHKKNFLVTSFFCEDTKNTKIHIEFLDKKENVDFNFKFSKQKYIYNNEIEDKNVIDSLSYILIFDLNIIDIKKRNFSKISIIDNFLILVNDEEILNL